MANTDPIETVINLLGTHSAITALTGTRIAGQHRYSTAWSTGLTGITATRMGSIHAKYQPATKTQIQIRVYGLTVAACDALYGVIIAFSKTIERQFVTVSGGRSMVYSFLPESGPQLFADEELGMVYLAGYFTLFHFDYVEAA